MASSTICAPEAGAIDLPPVKMTWEKFQRTVLPTAVEMKVDAARSRLLLRLGHGRRPGSAADPAMGRPVGQAAQPRLVVFLRRRFQFDSMASVLGVWVKVTAVFLGPHQWQEPTLFAHQGEKAFFALAGCWDGGRRPPGWGCSPRF